MMVDVDEETGLPENQEIIDSFTKIFSTVVSSIRKLPKITSYVDFKHVLPKPANDNTTKFLNDLKKHRDNLRNKLYSKNPNYEEIEDDAEKYITYLNKLIVFLNKKKSIHLQKNPSFKWKWEIQKDEILESESKAFVHELGMAHLTMAMACDEFSEAQHNFDTASRIFKSLKGSQIQADALFYLSVLLAKQMEVVENFSDETNIPWDEIAELSSQIGNAYQHVQDNHPKTLKLDFSEQIMLFQCSFYYCSYRYSKDIQQLKSAIDTINTSKGKLSKVTSQVKRIEKMTTSTRTFMSTLSQTKSNNIPSLRDRLLTELENEYNKTVDNEKFIGKSKSDGKVTTDDVTEDVGKFDLDELLEEYGKENLEFSENLYDGHQVEQRTPTKTNYYGITECWKGICGICLPSGNSPDDFVYEPNGPFVSYFNWTLRSNLTSTLISFVFIFYLMVLTFGLIMWGVGTSWSSCIIAAGDRYNENFWDAFHLSWTTFTTVGYGALYTATSNDHSNQEECVPIVILSTFESFIGLLFAGICTGVLYAKINRIFCHARVTFSDVLCVSQTNKKSPVLNFQLVNQLANFPGGEIFDAKVNVRVRKERENTGISKLETVVVKNETNPFFNRVWHVSHELDTNSPLLSDTFKANPNPDWSNLNVGNFDFSEVIITMTGISNISADTVHISKRISGLDSVKINKGFSPLLYQVDGQGIKTDLSKLNDVDDQQQVQATLL